MALSVRGPLAVRQDADITGRDFRGAWAFLMIVPRYQ